MSDFLEALEGAPLPVVIHQDDAVVFTNRSCREFLGLNPDDRDAGLGVSPLAFAPQSERESCAERTREILESGTPVVNYRRVALDGGGRPVTVVGAASRVVWKGKAAVEVVFMPLSQAQTVPEAARDRASQQQALLARLTPREREVALLAVEGLTIPTMAVSLKLKPDTVRGHLKSIYRKTKCHSRVELTRQLFGISQ